MVLSSNGVRGQKVYDLDGRESCITHTREDGIGRVRWLRDSQIRSGPGVVGAASKEGDAGAPSAVRYADSTCELDEVAERDLVFDGKGALLFDDLVNTVVGVCASGVKEGISRGWD